MTKIRKAKTGEPTSNVGEFGSVVHSAPSDTTLASEHSSAVLHGAGGNVVEHNLVAGRLDYAMEDFYRDNQQVALAVAVAEESEYMQVAVVFVATTFSDGEWVENAFATGGNGDLTLCAYGELGEGTPEAYAQSMEAAVVGYSDEGREPVWRIAYYSPDEARQFAAANLPPQNYEFAATFAKPIMERADEEAFQR